MSLRSFESLAVLASGGQAARASKAEARYTISAELAIFALYSIPINILLIFCYFFCLLNSFGLFVGLHFHDLWLLPHCHICLLLDFVGFF